MVKARFLLFFELKSEAMRPTVRTEFIPIVFFKFILRTLAILTHEADLKRPLNFGQHIKVTSWDRHFPVRSALHINVSHVKVVSNPNRCLRSHLLAAFHVYVVQHNWIALWVFLLRTCAADSLFQT